MPVIGAGTYASNRDGCAVSATGDGEYFIRATVARDICVMVGETLRWSDAERAVNDAALSAACHGQEEAVCRRVLRPVQSAADYEIADADDLGGKGGVIVMGLDGDPAFSMSTSGMYRGKVSSTAPTPSVAIYADEQ